MRKAVCKNNRQQVVFKEKSCGFERASGEVAAALKSCVGVCARARGIEKGMHFAAASMVNCLEPFLKATVG